VRAHLRLFNIVFSVIIRFAVVAYGLYCRVIRRAWIERSCGPPTLEELRMMVQASGKGRCVGANDEQQLLINVAEKLWFRAQPTKS